MCTESVEQEFRQDTVEQVVSGSHAWSTPWKDSKAVGWGLGSFESSFTHMSGLWARMTQLGTADWSLIRGLFHAAWLPHSMAIWLDFLYGGSGLPA